MNSWTEREKEDKIKKRLSLSLQRKIRKERDVMRLAGEEDKERFKRKEADWWIQIKNRSHQIRSEV